MCKLPAPIFNRFPRIRICCADSSPEAYRTLMEADSRAATSSMSVDLPTPGSPPKSIKAPGTTPPPSTRSNSAIPVGMRGVSGELISSKGTGEESQDLGESAEAAMRSSTKEFHSWQEGQRPIHLGELWPQCWQAYCVFAFNVSNLRGDYRIS